MKNHLVRTYTSAELLPREEQLAWKMAEVATDPVPLDDDVVDMIINRIIDNAAVSAASVDRKPVRSARGQATDHPKERGGNVFGLPNDRVFSPEWAAWANGVAVRELDFHDTFLAADYSHPADNIPAILAVAQTKGVSGKDFLRGVAAAYELHVNLVKGICLHEHKIDHIAHLGPAAAAGIAVMLGLDTETTYQAIQQALHTTTTTRQSRKGEISSWKAHAPAFAGKMAIEAVDRAMRGETSPSPAYEGEDGFIAWLLSGPEATYTVPLPEKGESKRAIMETYTKEHSAEYQAQALIDLSREFDLSTEEYASIDKIRIRTSHHTHYVIGTGANDPQKMDPKASRETLDHSIMYIVAVALEDRGWHHINSYTPERAQRESTIRVWNKIYTEEDPKWTERYHAQDPKVKAFGGEVTIWFDDGREVTKELAVADAHIYGKRPFGRDEYVQKFRTLAKGIISDEEQERFLDVAANVQNIPTGDGLLELNFEVSSDKLGEPAPDGIFS